MTREEAEAIIAALVTLREVATDEQALSVPSLYPAWRSGVEYQSGKRVLYNAVLYRVLQAHTSQDKWWMLIYLIGEHERKKKNKRKK